MIQILRSETAAAVAIVARRIGDFAAAEDAVQEALVAAAAQWPRDGVPAHPRAWLVHVALRRASDEIRADVARRRRQGDVVMTEPTSTDDVPDPGRDDTLVLLFMCCHPALAPGSAIPLTLRAVGGLTTAEIARAYLVPEATMAQRISRAKLTIQRSGAPFAMPAPDERGARLATVLHVLYLMFNEGHTASSGAALVRADLASEAIRLARGLQLVADEAEVAGLLALMLLTDARRAARATADGALVPLDEQDRSRWDRAQITEGVALLEATLPRGAIGPYQLQAAIAAVHDEAPTHAATDWPQILALYTVLEQHVDSPMVALSRAVAAVMVHGPATGLRLVEPLAGRLAHSHRLDAVRGHLHEMAGDNSAAAEHYRAAAAATTSIPERNYLLLRAARLVNS